MLLQFLTCLIDEKFLPVLYTECRRIFISNLLQTWIISSAKLIYTTRQHMQILTAIFVEILLGNVNYNKNGRWFRFVRKKNFIRNPLKFSTDHDDQTFDGLPTKHFVGKCCE